MGPFTNGVINRGDGDSLGDIPIGGSESEGGDVGAELSATIEGNYHIGGGLSV